MTFRSSWKVSAEVEHELRKVGTKRKLAERTPQAGMAIIKNTHALPNIGTLPRQQMHRPKSIRRMIPRIIYPLRVCRPRFRDFPVNRANENFARPKFPS
jgi:hypothetical protein